MSSPEPISPHPGPRLGMGGPLGPLIDAVRAALSATPNPVILIDGPSGAGKSTLADRLLTAWPGPRHPSLVRMDDLYPGWEGLEAGAAEVHGELLRARHEGRAARWRRYDWANGEPGKWAAVDADRPLLVEGCGTLLRANAPLAEVRVWVHGDDAVRKRRALARDRGGFDAHWDMWQAQFDAFVSREHPLESASIVVDGTMEDYREVMSAAEGHEQQYLVEYVDGPLAGRTDRRLLVRGEYDERLGAIEAVDGLESTFWYVAGDAREVQGMLHVKYHFDAPDSDPVESDAEEESL